MAIASTLGQLVLGVGAVRARRSARVRRRASGRYRRDTRDGSGFLRRAGAGAMVVAREGYLIFLGALVAERGFELCLSARNAWRTLARGGVEVGRGQYRIIVAFHALFIAACAAEALVYDSSSSSVPALTAVFALAGADGVRV